MKYQQHTLSVKLFSNLMRFSVWLQTLPNKLTPPPFRLLQIGSAFWQSRALYVIARLDVATLLAEDEQHVDEIAARLGTETDATYRILRMLSALGIFEETARQVFRNNKLSNYLREDRPDNVRAMILMHNSRELSQPWFEQLENGIKRGVAPFKLSHKIGLYDYIASHEDFASLFAGAMDSVESLSGDSFATDFNWRRFERIIDIGGSRGAKAMAILKHHPHLSALVLDQEQAVNQARQMRHAEEYASVLARMEFRAGDFLESVPAATSSKDIYFLSAILHGFDDETCTRILKNIVRAANNSGAAIAIMEMVLDEQQADFAATSFDMQMFMGTEGRERTLPEWQAIINASGARLEEIISLRSFGKILLLRI